MGISFQLLKRALENKEGDFVYIAEDDDGWRIELYDNTKEKDKFINVYGIEQTINLSTILEFLPKEGILFGTDIPAVNAVLKEMGLCQK